MRSPTQFLLPACLAAATFAQDVQDPVQVMTFNIRFGTANDGANRWMSRRRLVTELIRVRAPHLVGLQEALAFQIDQILDVLPHYRSFGQGRKGGRLGEHAAILVDTRRFAVEDHGDFWLSETPDRVASKGWDAALPRIASWVIVHDRQGDRRFAMINAHFDHVGRKARAESARLIARRLDGFAHLPTLVTGDFNAGESTKPIQALKGSGLRDTFRVALPEADEVGTFGGFKGKRGGAKIDYVLADMRWSVNAAEIVHDNDEGRFPSDHYPVTAMLSLPAKPRLMPVLDGPSWHITGMPDLGDMNSDRQEIVDHGIFQSNDGEWQIWACIRNTKIGRLLFRWQGESLTRGPWNATGTAMRASSDHGESINGWGGKEWLQAPFVIRKDDSHHMFYGGHLAENGECQICLATSEDGETFSRHRDKNGHSRLFVGPGEARDPMVLKVGEFWHCYYTGHDTGKRAPCKIYCRTSKDLLVWSAPIAVNWGGVAGSGNWSAECPFVVRREGLFYLFRTENYRAPLTHVYRSSDPLDFGKGNDSKRIGSIHVAAPEVVTHDGSSFISSVHDLKGGIQLFRLKWVPEGQAANSTLFLAKFEKLFDFEDGSVSRWAIDGEALRSQPTFTESGIVRGQHVAPQGQWYIGTYEHRPSPDTPAGRQQGDTATGTMRSPSFKLPSGRVTFLIGGGQDRETVYVALHAADTDEELFRATGRCSNIMRRVVWDVSEHAGEKAYLRVVDRSSAPWGHVNFDDFRVER